jgi:hypothetical protein
MAIAGSLIKGATKVVGKAINVAKKKKKDLEVKGELAKKRAKRNIIKDAKNAKDQSGKTIRENIKGVDAVPSAVAGAVGSTATKVGGKAVNIARNPKQTVDRATKKIKETATKVGDKLGDEAVPIAAGLATAGGILAGGGITNSLVKANSKPEQEYNITRMSDGRFSTTYKDKNANAVFSAKQLSEKEIDEVRTQLAVLDSIIDSTDPKARSKEFKDTVMNLAKKYKISNITGKNLSVIIPNVEGGVQLRQRA